MMSEMLDIPSHPTKKRRCFGFLLVAIASAIGVLGAIKAHHDGQMMQIQQDILLAVENSDEYPLTVLDKDGNVIIWNDAMERLTGLTCSDAKKSWIDEVICDPIKVARHRDGFAKAFTSPGKLTIVNCKIKTANGVETPVRVSIRIIEAGKEPQLYALARIDKESQVIEVGSPAREADKFHHQSIQLTEEPRAVSKGSENNL